MVRGKSEAERGRVREPAARYGGERGEIVLWRAEDGSLSLDVRLSRETLWLSQRQMAQLFDKETDTIGLHVRNVFRAGELDPAATTEESSVVQEEGGRTVRRRVRFYNLDVVISVGYRVNSKRGTQFRIWATRVLREHLIAGYTVNERKLREVNQAVRLVASVADRRDLSGDEATALLRVVGEYSFALELLDDYDHQRVLPPPAAGAVVHPLTAEEALRIVAGLRAKFGGSPLFGLEKDDGLRSALGAVMQSFGGRDVYPSLPEKAANLLYFLVKNHPFVDGNKRIGAALFLWFLDRNGALRLRSGERRISGAALVAVTLLVAESRPAERETIVRILAHLLCDRTEEGAR